MTERLSDKKLAELEPRRCNQCWKVKLWPDDFTNPRTGKVRKANCAECIDSNPEPRRGLDPHAPLRVLVIKRSGNRKHRGIPSTISSASTCPPSCAFFGNGCYAEYHNLRVHWSKVPERGLTWFNFCEWVSELPAGQLWRHNDAGDLPGNGELIDLQQLDLLVEVNQWARARGFTFSHKMSSYPRTGPVAYREAIRDANARGFTINLSANNLAHADRLANLKIGPVAVVLPEGSEAPIRTPEGRRVVICPAQTRDMTCADCQLCARPDRKSIVGFIAHGQSKARVSELVQLKRKDQANG